MGRIKAADLWGHPSRGIPSLPSHQQGQGHWASRCLCQDWGAVQGQKGVLYFTFLSELLPLKKAVMSFIVHLVILPTCERNTPFIRGIQIQQQRPRAYLENYLERQTAVLKTSLCALMLLSPQSDHTHQIIWLSTEWKTSILLYLREWWRTKQTQNL